MAKPTFIDLFSGCGGLSLGLTNAGLQGLFAVEKAPDAFLTFRSNLLENGDRSRFTWPRWLAKRHIGIEDFLAKYRHHLLEMEGKVSVIAGGPPCQGFSFAGRRNSRDPRNRLFRRYVEFVDATKPDLLFIENVPGMRVVHGAKKGTKRRERKRKSYYDKLVDSLASIGYKAQGRLMNAAAFGVPQNRPRLLIIGMKEEALARFDGGFDQVFEEIELCGREQARQMGLKLPVSVRCALSDLEIQGSTLVPCTDPASPKGFEMLRYSRPLTAYQRLMHGQVDPSSMDSMRLARHGDVVRARFSLILDECRRGVRMSDADRKRFGLLKHRIYPMAPSKPAPTLTTLPDDVLHYSEPRILTVREYARIQSFPDWYQFKGKYTTGGDMRKKDCPRYTQIGNAVPPLLAEAVGHALVNILQELRNATPHASRNGRRMNSEALAVGD